MSSLPRIRERATFVRVEVALDDVAGLAPKLRQVEADTDEVRKASILGIGPRDTRQEQKAKWMLEHRENCLASDQTRGLVELVVVVVDDHHELTDVAYLTDVESPEQVGHVLVGILEHLNQIGLVACPEHMVPVEPRKEQSDCLH